MTVLQSLKSASAYPVPESALRDMAEARGLDPDGAADMGVRSRPGFRLAAADVLLWLSRAPNVTQAGVSYAFTDGDRLNFRRRASAVYRDCGEALPGATYGYKGERI